LKLREEIHEELSKLREQMREEIRKEVSKLGVERSKEVLKLQEGVDSHEKYIQGFERWSIDVQRVIAETTRPSKRRK
jgi:F0F1-type ATP synthase membrane subunit b/b'